MQLRMWTAFIIFFGSYFPLSLILLAQDYRFDYVSRDVCLNLVAKDTACVMPFYHAHVSIPISLVSLICLFVSIAVLRITKTKRRAVIIRSTYVPSELMNYTLPYIVAFMGVGYNDQSKFVGMIIFLIWIFWITYKSGQLILNPILVVFGWRLYDTTFSFYGDKIEHRSLVLSDGELVSGDLVYYSTIQDVMVVRR